MPRKETNVLEGVPRYKSITVDAEIVEFLGAVAEELTAKFGFKPTTSQTLRFLLRSYRNGADQ